MKVLIVSIYDSLAGSSLHEFDGKSLKKVEDPRNNLTWKIFDYSRDSFYTGLTKEYKLYEQRIKEEVDKLFDKYDVILICEDGDCKILNKKG